MRGSDRTEVARRKVGVDVVELRMVESIEEVRLEFQFSAPLLAENEGLEERKVPVLAAWAT